MAQETFTPPETFAEPPGLEPREDRRRLASARDAFVAMLVCLLGWAFLFSPVLQRNAETGPLGTRRTVALAVLRPVAAISESTGISAVRERALRALGDDPDDPPGGELDLPDIDLPPLPPLATGGTGATGASGGPTGETAGDQTQGHGNGRRDDPSPGPKSEPDGETGADGPTAPGVGPIRMPSTNDKLRIAVVGDSLSQGLGPSVQTWFDDDVARVLPLGRQSTGLARQDYFNWPRAMREIEEAFRPDVVFIMLGTNDNQAQISPDGSAIEVGSVEWVEGYRERVAAFVHEATSAGTRVVWVGIPVVEEHRRWDFYRRVNAIYEDVADDDPLATFVDTWTTFEAKDGGYTAFLRNERGVVQEMRAGDGVHFTPTGYDYLARLSIRAADDEWGIPERAVTFRL
jgi:hypothetical protein